MGIILVFLTFSIICALFGYSFGCGCCTGRKERIKNARCGFVTGGTISTIIVLITLVFSYDSHLDMAKFKTTVWQDADALAAYKKDAIESFASSGDVLGGEVTDLKYNAYQEKLAEFIQKLRDKVKRYNSILIGKRVMLNSSMWSWVIVAPPADAELMDLSDYMIVGR